MQCTLFQIASNGTALVVAAGDQSAQLAHIKAGFQQRLRPDTPSSDPSLRCVQVRPLTNVHPVSVSIAVSCFAGEHAFIIHAA